MATALIKGVAAVGTLATASGVGTAIYFNIGTTIGDKLVAEGLKLISNEDDYQYHLFEHKDKDELKQAIGQQSISHLKHVSNLKQGCNSKVKDWASSDKDGSIFKNVKNGCIVPTIKTLRQKIKGDLHEEGQGQGKYDGFVAQEAIKTALLKALREKFTNFNFEEKASEGGAKLKQGCEDSMNLKTYEVTTNKSEANIRAWCLKG